MSASITDPGSLPILERRMGAYADSTQQQAGRIRVTIGQVVVAQLLPGALVKGGPGVQLRLGQEFARGSKDLVVAWCDAQYRFGDALRPSLAQGWGPFRGQLLAKSPCPRGRAVRGSSANVLRDGRPTD